MPFAKLSQPIIVDEALAVMQEEGLDQVSLRKIAGRLQVGVSSLYWHVADKETLYGLMSERIFASCLAEVPAAEDWADWLHGFGLALWRAQSRLPDALKLIRRSAMDGAPRDAFRDEIIAALGQAGLAPEPAFAAQRSVQALVTGWSTLRAVGRDAAENDREAFERALNVLIAGWKAAVADVPAPAALD